MPYRKDLLSIRDLTADELRGLLIEAFAIRESPDEFRHSLYGKALALLFEKPSLRTRVTFDVAIHQMGGFSICLAPAEVNLGRRESLRDVARNLERMVQGIVIRTFRQETVERLAAHARIPVINGLTDSTHPCQALADFMTILEQRGAVRGTRIAYVGDGNNVAHSLISGAALLGAAMTVASPPGYEPDPAVVEWSRAQCVASGGSLLLTREPAEAVAGADVVYTDVWTSMGQEEEAEQRKRIFRPYQVDAELFARARRHAIFMHCLPAHRGEEVTSSVLDGPRSVVFAQAENRLYVEKAVLLNLMGGRPSPSPREQREAEEVQT
jgi:ornithine carbamoyltransferase